MLVGGQVSRKVADACIVHYHVQQALWSSTLHWARTSSSLATSLPLLETSATPDMASTSAMSCCSLPEGTASVPHSFSCCSHCSYVATSGSQHRLKSFEK